MTKLACALIFIASLSLVGCAKQIQKEWAATGGSRADATVELSYDYIVQTENPVLNEQNAHAIALKRCKAWGYASTEDFGGMKYQDTDEQGGMMGRVTRRYVTKTYQCLGQGSETPVK